MRIARTGCLPVGKIKRGGITDKLLADYPHLFADLSANSGNNALSRDPEFAKGFLRRRDHKLIFGSDCLATEGTAASLRRITLRLPRRYSLYDQERCRMIQLTISGKAMRLRRKRLS